MITLRDQIGTEHLFPAPPLRIVSMVPSITELLFDLGLEDRIVGVTKFCVHPARAKRIKTIVGGTKKINRDKISVLQPDIIIANKEENTLEIVNDLKLVCTVWVTDIITLDDVYTMISDFGILFNCRTESQKWNGKISSGMAEFAKFMQHRPVRKTAYFIWRDPYMAAGGNTFIDEMLKLNHFENIFRAKGRYPEVELEKLRIDGDPELVLLSSEPYPFKEEHAFEIGRFTHHAKTIFVDGEMFSWYGSRLIKAIQYFRILQQRIK